MQNNTNIFLYGDCKDIENDLDYLKTIIGDAMKQDDKQGEKSDSNTLFNKIKDKLEQEGYVAEKSKNNPYYLKLRKHGSSKDYRADAIHKTKNIVFEFERGRAVQNYQILKDFIECVVSDELEINKKIVPFIANYLVVAMPEKYRVGDKEANDSKRADLIFANISNAFFDDDSPNKCNVKGIALIVYNESKR